LPNTEAVTRKLHGEKIKNTSTNNTFICILTNKLSIFPIYVPHFLELQEGATSDSLVVAHFGMTVCQIAIHQFSHRSVHPERLLLLNTLCQ